MSQDVVQDLLDRVEALTRQVKQQQADIERLQALAGPAGEGTASNVRGDRAPYDADDAPRREGTRRDLLIASAGMAVVAAAFGDADPAQADFRATVIMDSGNAYGGLGAPGGNPGSLLPALGATTHGLIGVAEAGSAAPAKKSGVLGTSKTSVGVQALSVSGFGVYARSRTGVAVHGASLSKHGMRGECVTAYGAVDGVTAPLAGVLGISNKAHGVAGIATGTTGAGVMASSRNASIPALAAVAASATAPGVVVIGTTSLNGSLTATGNVTVNGDLAVTGAKSAAILHSDGKHRLVYCVEAPEAWLEDFGEGSVTNGVGEVALDPDFAGLCEPGSFHVFIAEHCDFPIRVTARESDGFRVAADREIAALKGLGPVELHGTFSYRVVGRRKDRPGVRLQPFVIPQAEREAAQPREEGGVASEFFAT